MIVNNLTNKIYIVIDEGDYNAASYLIESLFDTGCSKNEVVTQGTITGNNLSLNLKDGYYKITIQKDDKVSLEQKFYVYYNAIPIVIEKLLDILCPCNNCEEKEIGSTSDFLFFIGFMQSIGKLCSNNIFSLELNKIYKEMLNENEYKKYYGNVRNNTAKNLEKLAAYLYIELYSTALNSYRDSTEETEVINSLYKIDQVEKCLYNKGYDFEEIICNFEKSNCGCDD